MEANNAYYDDDSTIYSPDGRLFQVEYARETVKKGSTILGLKYKDGVLLITYKDINNKLIETRSIDKVTQIDNNICCTFTGLMADARHLIDFAQDDAAMSNVTYDEPINVKTLVRNICEYKHLFTTFYGVRPFGVVMLFAGIDSKGAHLFATDPSGAFLEYKAVCEGKNSDKVREFFDKEYTQNLNRDAAIDFGLKGLQKTIKKKIDPNDVELVLIEKHKPFHKIILSDLLKNTKRKSS